MKKLLCKSIAVVAILAMYFLCTGFSSTRATRGDGNVVSSEKTVSEFQKINSVGTANVRFHASDKHRVVVTVDANLYEYVEISTRNGVLHIEIKAKGEQRRRNRFIHIDKKPTQFVVDVYAPTLSGVSIAGSGSFTAVDKVVAPTFAATVAGSGRISGTFESSNFSGKISGSGSINGTFEGSRFSANISGSGRITAAGASENADVTISGSGSFNGNNFNAKNATVRISGSGIANVCVENSLEARVSGSGNINYCGNPPTVNSNVSGSGIVRKM